MAQVRTIEFDDDEDLSAVVIRLSAPEAAYLAKLTGRQSPNTANGVMAGGAEANRDVHNALTRVLNGLYDDDGVNDWPGERG